MHRLHVLWLGLLLVPAPARAALPICGAAGDDAITSVTPPLYRGADVGRGLVVEGSARAGATGVELRLAGGVPNTLALSGAGTVQPWSMAIAASSVEALPDGVIPISLRVLLPGGDSAIGQGSSFEKNVQPPAPVTDLFATADASSVALRWRNPVDADLERVRILRSTSRFATAPDDVSGQAVAFEGSASSFLDGNRTAGTWLYTVFARDLAGNWSAGATASATVDATTGGGDVSFAFGDTFDSCESAGFDAQWLVDGRWYCRSGRVRGETAGGTMLVAQLLGETVVSSKLWLTSVASGSGVVARAGGGSGYAAQLVPGVGVQLVRRGATPAVLATAARSISALVGYRVLLRVTGSAPVVLEAALDGVVVATASDGSPARIASGYAGLLSGSDARTQFEEFTLSGSGGSGATPVPPPEPAPAPAPEPSPPPPSPPLATSFVDDFDACDSTSDLGTRWTTAGRWYCTALRARGESAAGLAMANVTFTGDLAVRARVVHTGAASGSGIVSRRSGGSYYLARLVSTGRVELVRVTNGLERLLASAPVASATTASHSLRLVTRGTSPVQLALEVDGRPIASFTDDAAERLSDGGVGLLSGSGARTQFDDFRAEPP